MYREADASGRCKGRQTHPGSRQGIRRAQVVYREADAPGLEAQTCRVGDKEVYALGRIWQGGDCIGRVTNRQTLPVGDEEAYAPGLKI